jgi:hypothetical protein
VLAVGMTAILVYIARRSWSSRTQRRGQTEIAPELIEQE